jgi:hypothetical protein
LRLGLCQNVGLGRLADGGHVLSYSCVFPVQGSFPGLGLSLSSLSLRLRLRLRLCLRLIMSASPGLHLGMGLRLRLYFIGASTHRRRLLLVPGLRLGLRLFLRPSLQGGQRLHLVLDSEMGWRVLRC